MNDTLTIRERVVSEGEDGSFLFWPSSGVAGGEFALLTPEGKLVTGSPAVPTADELKDNFSPVLDAKRSTMLLNRARAAASSANPSR